MNWKYLFLAICLDAIFELVLYCIRVWRRKHRMRYFLVWYSYKVVGVNEKIMFDTILLSQKQFINKEKLYSDVVNQKHLSVISLRISNILEFKNKEDYENFSK